MKKNDDQPDRTNKKRERTMFVTAWEARRNKNLIHDEMNGVENTYDTTDIDGENITDLSDITDIDDEALNLDDHSTFITEWQTQLSAELTYAKRSIMIHTYGLQEDWLQSDFGIEQISKVARAGRRRIRVLVSEPDTIQARAGSLLHLIQRIPSRIQIKVLTVSHTEPQNSFVLIDEKTGSWLKPWHQLSQADWLDGPESRLLGDWFTRGWEQGFDDPNLRNMKI